MRDRLSDRARQRLRIVLAVLATAVFVAPAAALATHGFTDVDSDDFFHDAVNWAKDNGVTVGCNPPNNTRYCPDDAVSRGEMAVFLERLDSKDVFVRPGDTMFAVVDTDGTLARGSRAVSSDRTGTGQYEVIFDRDVTECGYQATIGGPQLSSGDGESIGVARRNNKANGVYVQVTSNSGGAANQSFHLSIDC